MRRGRCVAYESFKSREGRAGGSEPQPSTICASLWNSKLREARKSDSAILAHFYRDHNTYLKNPYRITAYDCFCEILGVRDKVDWLGHRNHSRPPATLWRKRPAAMVGRKGPRGELRSWRSTTSDFNDLRLVVKVNTRDVVI
jgi:hypothetical protein